MTSVINSAHAHGTRVVLTVESFAWESAGASSQTALLSSPSASLNAAQQIAAEVNGRGADGVDLDFEPIAPGQSANYVSFVRTLRAQLDALHPGYELTFCGTGAPGTYDLPDLLAPGAADAVFIMGYNLRGGTPAYTGSIDPLTTTTNRYSLTSVVNTYLSQVAPSKVILGLPWYGEAWSTGTSTALDAPPGDWTTYGQPVEVNYACADGLAAENPVMTLVPGGLANPFGLGKFTTRASRRPGPPTTATTAAPRTPGASSTSTTRRPSPPGSRRSTTGTFAAWGSGPSATTTTTGTAI